MFCCPFSVFLWPWCPSLVQWLELSQSHQVMLGALSILVVFTVSVAYFWLDLWFESEPARVFETIPGSRVCIQIMKAGVRQWGVDTDREAGVLGGGGDKQQRLPQGWGHPTWWVMQAWCLYGPLGSDARSGASDVPLWRWALTCVVIVEREWDHACQKHLAQCLARIEHTTNVKYHCCYYSCQCNTWLLKGGISWYRWCAGKITSSVACRMAETRSTLIH